MKSTQGMWVFIALWVFGVLGSLWTARAEGMIPVAPSQFASPPIIFSTPVPFPTLTSTPRLGQTAVPSLSSPTPFCPRPTDWQTIIIASNDTLQSLASRYHTTPLALQRANCLTVTTLLPSTRFYVPPLPTSSPSATMQPTPTQWQCMVPTGWIIHIVRSGENLYRISLAYRVSIVALQNANCLAGTLIYTGQRLWVPHVPTSTPVWTATPTATFTTTPTLSPTVTPSPTNTPTPTPTNTDTPLPTPTPTNTPTSTPTFTVTPTPTPTFTLTPTPTFTHTPAPTSTSTSTSASTPTSSPSTS